MRITYVCMNTRISCVGVVPDVSTLTELLPLIPASTIKKRVDNQTLQEFIKTG